MMTFLWMIVAILIYFIIGVFLVAYWDYVDCSDSDTQIPWMMFVIWPITLYKRLIK